MRILVATDAWAPQINGVVRTLVELSRELTALGHTLCFVTPQDRATVPLPTYPEIRLALFPKPAVAQALDKFSPDALHIATEGPIGFAARALALERGLRFTTAFHTRFPDYVRARLPFIPEAAVYRVLRAFHQPAAATMVPTLSLKRELEQRGFARLVVWSRGVDVGMFRPGIRCAFEDIGCPVEHPVFLYVGRIAVEKNVEAFLALDLPGTKVVIGDGPQRAGLAARYPSARFLGQRTGHELARLYASSDVFVFPSRTDTFGLVLLEALASGVPVAAYDVQAPRDLLSGTGVGVFHADLRQAALTALSLSREQARAFALGHSWRASSRQFLAHLVPLAAKAVHPAA